MSDVRESAKYRWVHDRCKVGPRARYRLDRVVIETRTRYQEVGIYDLYAFGRALFLDGVLQSAEADEHRYHECLVHPGMLVHPAPRRVLITGGGEGATLREVLRHATVEEAVMSELDRELVALCRRYMAKWSDGAFDDPRSKIIYGDARRLIERRPGAYDVCICDLTEPTEGGASTMLFTVEFFREVKRCLRRRGLLVTQAGALGRESCRMFLTLRATLGRVFRHVRGYWARIPSFREPWGFLCASDALDPRSMSPDDVRRRMEDRNLRGLRYYRPSRHPSLFILPRTVRRSWRDGPSMDRSPFTLE